MEVVKGNHLTLMDTSRKNPKLALDAVILGEMENSAKSDTPQTAQ